MSNINLSPYGKLHEKTRKALKAFRDTRIDEIENIGADDGVFFVWLKSGYDWNVDDFENITFRSFTTAKELKIALKKVKPQSPDKSNYSKERK